MPRSLSYADAARLMGGTNNTVVAALDTLLGGTLLAATAGTSQLALSLFDAKSELTKVSEQLAGLFSQRLSGLGRIERSERLAAAHAVVVVTAYFETLRTADLPIRGSVLELTKKTQVSLATGVNPNHNRLAEVAQTLCDSPLPTLHPSRSLEQLRHDLQVFYAVLGLRIVRFVAGLAVWDTLSETEQHNLERILGRELAEVAITQYDVLLRRLAAEFPELGFYVDRIDHAATRARVGELATGLSQLQALLERISVGVDQSDARTALTRRYLAELGRPIVDSGTVPADLNLPTLSQGYVDPGFRVTTVGRSDRLHLEEFWSGLDVQTDLSGFLAALLSSQDAAHRPLIVLGQPGSGKSVLTKILAGSLPPSDFLVVRVVLRQTPAEADIQTQVEQAVREATGEARSWPDLSRTAGSALRVVILDGFDELLQATGVSRSNYLLDVVGFQEREADQGRPVAVIVTTRISVADRATIPADGAVALRLEPFDDAQVAGWLEVWSQVNAQSLGRRELRPLPASAALAHPELARQPLLLLLLALYDADQNELQHDGAALSSTALYERLLTRFAHREISKSRPGLSEPQFQAATTDELFRLSVVALGMFHRGRQWITQTELDADLRALIGDAPARRDDFKAAMTPAEATVGGFFFIHHVQALQAGQKLSATEFLHATFGEYLVARLIGAELQALGAVSELDLGHGRAGQFNTDLLMDALSYTPLTMRDTVVQGLNEILTGFGRERRDLLGRALIAMLAAVNTSAQPSRSSYAPIGQPPASRQAMQSLNLTLLIVILRDRVSATELFGLAGPNTDDPVQAWRAQALLWQSQCTEEGWRGLISGLAVVRRGTRFARDLEIILASDDWTPPPIEPLWLAQLPSDIIDPPFGWGHHHMLELYQSGYFLCDERTEIALHALESLDRIHETPGADSEIGLASSFAGLSGGRSVSAVRALLDLWAASTQSSEPDGLVYHYKTCLEVARWAFADENQTDRELFLALMMRQLVADRRRLPATLLADVEREFRALLEGKRIRTVPRTDLAHWTSLAFPQGRLSWIFGEPTDWPEQVDGPVT